MTRNLYSDDILLRPSFSIAQEIREENKEEIVERLDVEERERGWTNSRSEGVGRSRYEVGAHGHLSKSDSTRVAK